MKTVEVHTSGLEQTISLPPDCHIDATQVFVKRVGKSLLLIPGDMDPWQLFSQGLDGFTDDFMSDRSQPVEQERRGAFE